jgi:protein involved in polysaccharide export with SLBB domain
MNKKSAVCAVLTSLILAGSGALWAQDVGLQSASQNQGSTTDCSSPFNAGLAQCQAPMQASGAIPAVAPAAQFNGNLPRYTDTEQLLRQNAAWASPQAVYPPGPLTEFQKFVASTTGQLLPIYGANLFRNVPSTFAPLNLTPVPPNYTIGPGDELRIRVWGQVNFQANVSVDRTGDIYLPQIGEVRVAGLPYAQLREHLRSAIGRVYKNFNLTADVGQIRSIQVYVTGEAQRPGVYTVSSLSTLVDALFASGGPSPTGSLRDISLRRNGRTIAHFDLYSLLIHGNKSGDVSLQSGDVIFIPPVGPQVAITGSVKEPAIYELRRGETLAGLLSDAGGATAVAAQTQVSIERIDDHRDRYAMQVNYDKAGLGILLKDGDLIQILPILPEYSKTVILRGNTANPGRFAWHPGMRLSDLIPDKASLITRNYWWKRAQLGLPTQEFEPLRSFSNLRQPSIALQLPRNQMLGLTPPQPGTESPEARAAGVPPPQPLQETSSSQGQQTMSGANSESGGGLSGINGPVAGSGQGFQIAPNPRNSQNSQNGQGQTQQQQLGVAQRADETMAATRTVVGPIAPELDWNYAVIQRQNPKTLQDELIPFDLGKLVLQHDASQNLLLKPGDVVTVFSQADIRVPVAQQTKFVALEGEFVRAGIYTVKPGETLRELVAQAGGLTPQAYLYGSSFTRRSTRLMQQRRMDDYVESLQMQMARGTLALESAAVTTGHGLTIGGSGQSTEQQLIGQLKQMQATGRIVLQMPPGSHGANAIPNIVLENGDRFVVPPIPATVNVVGAVYDQNSFLYQKGARVGTYLRFAGGPNRDADRKAAFIIRADGSVVSRSAAGSIWGNEFDSLRLNPGDTIVIPDKVLKPSALAGILNWSQLFSQFALGAAALSVIQ